MGLVIRNLLSNAIKFSHEGAEIIVSYTKVESNHHILIKDFGVGMSDEFLKRLSVGMSESSVGTGQEKGTGLGLELSREFLIALNGSLEIRSQKGKGTEVDILIPSN